MIPPLRHPGLGPGPSHASVGATFVARWLGSGLRRNDDRGSGSASGLRRNDEVEFESASVPRMSSSGLARGSRDQLAPAFADGWMAGTSPAMTWIEEADGKGEEADGKGKR